MGETSVIRLAFEDPEYRTYVKRVKKYGAECMWQSRLLPFFFPFFLYNVLNDLVYWENSEWRLTLLLNSSKIRLVDTTSIAHTNNYTDACRYGILEMILCDVQ